MNAGAACEALKARCKRMDMVLIIPNRRWAEELMRIVTINDVPSLTSGRLASLTSRSRYSSDRIFEELGFAFAKPMPEGIEDVVKASL